MSTPLFLVDAERLRASERVVLDGREGRHAADVRRIGVGESIDLSDGKGHLARSEVVEADRSSLVCQVHERVDVPVPTPRLVVAQALAKGDRGELAVEMMTEVGVDEIVPWAAQRNVVRWDGERGRRALDRWRSTAREAAKQSRRAWIPDINELTTTDQLAERLRNAERAVVLHHGPPLGEVSMPREGEIVLVVGPEGGITSDELETFRAAGSCTAGLGPTILRTSTAGTVAAAIVLSSTGRWAATRQ